MHMNESPHSQSSFVAFKRMLRKRFVNAAPDLWPHTFQSLKIFRQPPCSTLDFYIFQDTFHVLFFSFPCNCIQLI